MRRLLRWLRSLWRKPPPAHYLDPPQFIRDRRWDDFMKDMDQ